MRSEAGPTVISVPLAELEARAKSVEIYDVRPFMLSRVFRTNGYQWNEALGTITKQFGTTAA